MEQIYPPINVLPSLSRLMKVRLLQWSCPLPNCSDWKGSWFLTFKELKVISIICDEFAECYW